MEQRPVHLLQALQQAGFDACFVGGCVRDILLGRPVHDWDIATSALPHETMAVFPKCIPTGEKHGTVTVVDGGENYEITTFRTDGSYCDGRHPEQVRFVPSLEEDLARRDFTVNAMAMDARGNITDLFGGKADLQKKIIRCVGDPDTRFREDALRMLRALRFSAQLGFSLDGKSYAALRRCAPLCAALSAERVRDEVEKTLLSPDPQAVGEMIRLGLLCAFGLQGCPELTALEQLPCRRTVRWAGFFRACPQASWEEFRLDKKTGTAASAAAALGGMCRSRIQMKKLLSRHGKAVGLCTAALDGQTALAEEILTSGECLTLHELALSGRDLPHLQGQAVGRVLGLLLEHVLAHPEDNCRETLLALTQDMI